MRNIIRNPEAQFPETFKSIYLNGPDGGVDSASCLVSRVPPGHHGPRLHTHPSDQFYFVFEGETTVQIGTDILKVKAPAVVRFPAGTPHCNWNETDAYEWHFELIVPRPPADNVMSYWEGEVPHVPEAARLVTPLRDEDFVKGKQFFFRTVAERANGSPQVRLYAARVPPGAGGPPLHFHDFDQFYYVFGGELTVRVGHEIGVARAGDLVMLPRGCLHTNWNAGDQDEFHLAIIIPEPAEGGQFDYKVDVKYEKEPAFARSEPEARP